MTAEGHHHPLHHPVRLALMAGGLLVLVAIVVVLGVGRSRSSAPPPAPLAPRVTPGAGTLLVSWAPPPNSPGSGASEIRSNPRQVPCVTAAEFSCTVGGIVDATPWTFSVRQEVAGRWSAWSPDSTPVPHVSILIVAGQSNAVGVESEVVDPLTGTNILTSTASPADTQVPLAWNQPDVAPSNNGLAQDGPGAILSPQILTGPGPAQGRQIFGPEISLARDLWGAGRKNIVMLKVAEAGTALGGGGPWNPNGGRLFNALVAAGLEVQRAEATLGNSATIGAINWYQGESDSTPELAGSYKANLTAFLESLRRDLHTSPSTPEVLVKSSMAAFMDEQQATGRCTPAECNEVRVASEQVRAAADAVAAAVPHVSTVESLGLPRTGWYLHLSNVGELKLGALLSEADLAAGIT